MKNDNNTILSSSERITLVFILLTMPLIGAGIDMNIPSLPTIAVELHTSTSLTQLSIATFIVGYALSQCVAGFLIDRIGRRKVYLVGMLGFILSNFAAALATSIETLLLARFIQGMMIAAPGVAARTLLIDTFREKRLHKYSTYVGSAWALGVIVSPLIGGYLQHYIGWQASFVFIGMFSSILCLFALSLLKEPDYDKNVSFAEQIVGVKAMLGDYHFMSATIIMSLAYGVMVLFHVVGPFLVQVVMGHSVKMYGYLSLGLGVSWFIGMNLNNFGMRWLAWSTTKMLIQANHAMLVISVVMVISVLIWSNLITLMLPLYLSLIFGAIVFINAMSQSLMTLKAHKGIGSAVVGTFNMLGVTIVSSLGALLNTDSAIPLALSMLLLSLMIFQVSRSRTLVSHEVGVDV